MPERRINKAAVVSLLLTGGTIVLLGLSEYHLNHAEQKIRTLLTEQPQQQATLDALGTILARMGERRLTETPTPTSTLIPR